MKVIIYTSNACSNCEMAKSWLAENEITDVEYANVSENPIARKQLMSMGIMSVPTLVVAGHEPLVGFNKEKYSELLLTK